MANGVGIPGHPPEEGSMPGLKENLETLKNVMSKNAGVLWNQAQETLRTAAIDGMRHRKDPVIFEQRGQEVDDATAATVWLEQLAHHLTSVPIIRHDSTKPKANPAPVDGPRTRQQPPIEIEKPAGAQPEKK
jgi:hypothetical protein